LTEQPVLECITVFLVAEQMRTGEGATGCQWQQAIYMYQMNNALTVEEL